MKYSAWPYRLFKASSGDWEVDVEEATAEVASGSSQCCLDTFTHGLRQTFGGPALMRSEKSKLVINSALDSVRVTSDWCERQNR